MKLHKRIIVVFSLLLFSLILIACDDEKQLTEITLNGVDNVTSIEFDTEFNILTGVTAVGDDGKDYTELITFSTTSAAISEDGTLDTKVPGEHMVRYRVTVGEVETLKWRSFKVDEPERTGDELIQNGDFSQGTAYWTGDQGSIKITVVDGVLEADVEPGSQTHEPRLFQMGIPFEEGKTYEIKFEAKSSVEKVINLQVGELLDNSPWFVDFKPMQIEKRTITTDWASYSYTFKHNLDNDRGGVLFEFGPIDGEAIAAVISLRNIEAVEVEPVADTAAPVFSGLADRVFEVGTDFNPLTGVTAYDLNDGDVTAKIEVVITNADDEEVTTIDTDVAGVYTLEYKVTDEAGNTATETITVTIEEMQFSEENLIVNGDFTQPLGDEWVTYFAEWTNAGVSKAIVDGKLEVDTTGLGDASWHIQLYQDGLTLEKGKTYRLSFTIESTVERDIGVEVGVTNEDFSFTAYMDLLLGIPVSDEVQTLTYVFTVTEETTENGKVVLHLGKVSDGDLPGKFVISNISLNERYFEPLITADFTDERHVLEQADGVTHATAERTEDDLTITVNTVGGEAYIPHYFYLLDGLQAGTYEYRISVTADVLRHLRFNIIVPDWGFASILPPVDPEDETSARFVDFETKVDELVELVIEFTVGETINEQVKIELDFGPIGYEGETLIGEFVLSNVSLERK